MVALGSVFSLTLKKISWKSWLSQSYIYPFFSIISFQSCNADSSVKTATHPKKIKKKFQVQHTCHSAWSREAESQNPPASGW